MHQHLNYPKFSNKEKIISAGNMFKQYYNSITCRMDSVIKNFVKKVLNVLTCGYFKDQLFKPSIAQNFSQKSKATLFAYQQRPEQNAQVVQQPQAGNNVVTVRG